MQCSTSSSRPVFTDHTKISKVSCDPAHTTCRQRCCPGEGRALDGCARFRFIATDVLADQRHQAAQQPLARTSPLGSTARQLNCTGRGEVQVLKLR